MTRATFTPTKHGNACQICGNEDGRCRTADTVHLCMNTIDTWTAKNVRGFKFVGTTKDNLWGKFIERDDSLSQSDRDSQRQHWQQVKAQRQAAEQQHRSAALPAIKRDQLYCDLLSQLSLHPTDRADLHRRGLNDEQIKAGGFKSVEQWQRLRSPLSYALPGVNLDGYSLNTQPGYLCPIYDVDRLLVGFQIRMRAADQGGRYRWLSSKTRKRPNGATAHLPNGENPLTVARPVGVASGWRLRVDAADRGCTCHHEFTFVGSFNECEAEHAKQKPVNEDFDFSNEADRLYPCDCTFTIERINNSNGAIGMAEGNLKPFIAAQKLGQVVVGATGGQFANSPETLKATLEKLTAELETRAIVFYPDGGAIENQSVLKQYRSTWKLLQDWGYKVSIAWWGQFTKAEPDIDELENYSAIEFISVARFWELANDCKREKHKAQTAKVQAALNSLTHQPTVTLNQQYLSDIHLPEKGGYLFISSAMGTGKTTQLANLKAEYRSRHPQGKIRAIGHRIGLLRQSGAKLGIPLLNDLDFEAGSYDKKGKLSQLQVSHLEAVGLCINSLLRLDVDSLDGAMLIFDEIDALLKSLSLSKLLKRDRAYIMQRLQKIVRHVLNTGGYIIGMEAKLTDLAIDFLRDIGHAHSPMELVVNEWQGQPWDVTIYSNSGSTFLQEAARFPGRQVVVSDSQKFGEELERLMRGSGKKIIRVDGKTAERDDVRALLANPTACIDEQQYDCVILSPTLESGGDIANRGYFDRVAFNLCNLETRSQMQLLGRVRDGIPRVGVVSSKAAGGDETGRSLNPDTIRSDLYKNADELRTFTQLADLLQQGSSEDKTYRDRLIGLLDPDTQSEEGFWVDFYCKYKARENGARSAMADNLIEALRSDGHNVKTAELPKCKEDAEIRAELRKEIEWEEAGSLAYADGSKFDVDEAKEKLQTPGTTEADRFAARKTLLQDDLPGVELTREFVFKNEIQERGASLKAATLLWMSQNMEIAKELDRRALKRELGQPFVYVPDLPMRGLKANLLNRSGLVDLIGDRDYMEADEDLQQFKKWAVWARFEIKRLLGMTINEDMTAIKVFCKFARKLGYDLDNCKKGKRDEQVRIYRITNLEDGDRTAILEALSRKYAEIVPQTLENVSRSDTVSTTFPLNKPFQVVDTEVVDTGGAAATDDPWLAPDSLADIRSMWESADCEQARAELRLMFPGYALERAIA